MPEVIISDTSCLIILDKIGQLDLLKRLYSNIVTTPIVAEEFGRELPKWIRIEAVQDLKYQNVLEIALEERQVLSHYPCNIKVHYCY